MKYNSVLYSVYIHIYIYMKLCHNFTVKAKLYCVVEEINTLTHHMYMAYSKEGKGDV